MVWDQSVPLPLLLLASVPPINRRPNFLLLGKLPSKYLGSSPKEMEAAPSPPMHFV